jgi:hypothetical protein
MAICPPPFNDRAAYRNPPVASHDNATSASPDCAARSRTTVGIRINHSATKVPLIPKPLSRAFSFAGEGSNVASETRNPTLTGLG